MFDVKDMNIMITRGDSGLLTITTQSNVEFTEYDRVIFTVKSGNRVIKQDVIVPGSEGDIQITFLNAETEKWNAGSSYKWDVRYVLDAIFDEDGHVVDGREVITPMQPRPFTVLEAVGDV